MPEGKDVSSLSMDTALPLGNSEDTFIRRALHVKIGNKTTEPIPVFVADEEPGVPFFDEGFDVTDPGNDVTLITTTVPALTTRNLFRIIVTCRIEGVMTILDGATQIGSGRTGAAKPDSVIEWNPRRPVSTGNTITVKFKARTGSAVSDVEAYLMASDITA
jgi:hypothetical protein